MDELALVLWGVYLVLAFGVRVALQLRRTGRTGVVGISGRPGSLEWVGGVLFVVALLMAFAGVFQEPIGALDTGLARGIGLVLTIGGILGTFVAQLAMGDAWRVGVDESERTELVTSGPFALVRNPIYSAMLPTVAGLALLVPNVLSIGGALALLLALELQTRGVEEPYLLRTHGRDYADYAGRVGRFVPGIGRLARR